MRIAPNSSTRTGRNCHRSNAPPPIASVTRTRRTNRASSSSLLSFDDPVTDAKRTAAVTVPFCSAVAASRLRLGPVKLRRGRVRHHRGAGDLHFVLKAVDHRRFALQHGVPTGLGDIARIVLLRLSDLRVVELRPVEEVGLGRAWLETGYRNAAVFDFFVQRRREAVNERFRAIVHGLERAGHVTGDRTGYQHLALAAFDHALHDRLDQHQRAGNVGIDDVQPFIRRLIKKAMAEAMARIGNKYVDWSIADG